MLAQSQAACPCSPALHLRSKQMPGSGVGKDDDKDSDYEDSAEDDGDDEHDDDASDSDYM